MSSPGPPLGFPRSASCAGQLRQWQWWEEQGELEGAWQPKAGPVSLVCCYLLASQRDLDQLAAAWSSWQQSTLTPSVGGGWPWLLKEQGAMAQNLYGPGVRMGNWNEDIYLEEVRRLLPHLGPYPACSLSVEHLASYHPASSPSPASTPVHLCYHRGSSPLLTGCTAPHFLNPEQEQLASSRALCLH